MHIAVSLRGDTLAWRIDNPETYQISMAKAVKYKAPLDYGTITSYIERLADKEFANRSWVQSDYITIKFGNLDIYNQQRAK